MKMTYLFCIVALLVTAGCGIHVSSDPVKVEGNVTHTVVISAAQLADFFKEYCESKAENQTQEEMDQCVAEQLALFWQAVNKSTASGNVDQK